MTDVRKLDTTIDDTPIYDDLWIEYIVYHALALDTRPLPPLQLEGPALP